MAFHQQGKRPKRSWILPAFAVAGVIVLGVLATISQRLLGLGIPSRIEPNARKSFLIIAEIIGVPIANGQKWTLSHPLLRF